MSGRKSKPEAWVTHLCGILAGDAQCHYQPWVKANFWYAKVPEDRAMSLVQWKSDHTEFVNRIAAQAKAVGAVVTTEDQNKFKVTGATCIVGGKPDVVAVQTVVPPEGDGIVLATTRVTIKDAKTGQPSDEHIYQVFIYMLLWPKIRPELAHAEICGEIVYKDHVVDVPRAALTSEIEARIYALIREVGFGVAPEALPSPAECGRCPVAATDCPSRIDSPVMAAETTDF